MRYLILCGLAMAVLTMKSVGQSVSIPTDSVLIDRQMPLYKVSSCLADLFADIVKADKPDFNARESFYSLTFIRVRGYRYLNIDHERWNASVHVDFQAVIKVNGAMFLCRGNFYKDELFQKIGDSVRVKVRRATDPNDTISLGFEPSLSGAYLDCKGVPISLEVYIRNQIPGYGMKERPVRPKN